MAGKWHRDIIVGAVLLVFSLLVLSVAVRIKGDARVVPTALTILMALCSIAIMRKGIKETREGDGEYHYSMTLKNSKNALLFYFFVILYYFGFQFIGYWISTIVFMPLIQYFLKGKSWKVNLIVTVCYVVILFVLFVVILQLPVYREGITGKWFRYIR